MKMESAAKDINKIKLKQLLIPQLEEGLRGHHKFIKETVPLIKELLRLLTINHGQINPELICINEKFSVLVNELFLQIKKDEEEVFPMLKYNNSKETLKHIKLITRHEQSFLKALFRDIRTLSNDYNLPTGACKVYTLTYQRLQAFDRQLTLYLDIESCFHKNREV
ncbi:hypothetical protein MASR2M41_02030 [Flammeovirgaceae bacterium]